MLWRKLARIHFVSEQNVSARFGQRNAPRKLHRASRSLCFFKVSAIGAFENHVACSGFDSSAIEYDRQRNPGPFRCADCAQPPLHAFHFRFEKIAVVPRAFQRHGNRQRF